MIKTQDEMQKFIDSFGERYGPYAFGIISLLLIWFLIVRPELESQRIEFRTQQEVVRQLEKTASTMESTANTMRATAQILDRAVEKLAEAKDDR